MLIGTDITRSLCYIGRFIHWPQFSFEVLNTSGKSRKKDVSLEELFPEISRNII